MIAVISSSVNIIVILVDLVEEDISVSCDIIGGRAIVDRVLKSTCEELVSIVVVATLTLDVIWPSLLVIVNIVDLGWASPLPFLSITRVVEACARTWPPTGLTIGPNMAIAPAKMKGPFRVILKISPHAVFA